MARRSTVTFPARKARKAVEPPPVSLELVRRYGVLGEGLALTTQELLDIAGAAGLEPERTLGNGIDLFNPRQLREAAFILYGCSQGHAGKPMTILSRTAEGRLTTCNQCLYSRANLATARSDVRAPAGTIKRSWPGSPVIRPKRT
jgi:hypothetical protein